MSPRTPSLGALALFAAAACVSTEKSPRDRELEGLVGVGAFRTWHCEPDGPRELRAGWHRGERCSAEQRTASMLSAGSIRRDARGHVMDAIRSWGLHDSVHWSALRDSLNRVYTERTAAAAACGSGRDSMAVGGLATRFVMEMWRLPGYDLVVTSSVTPTPGRPLFQAKVEARVTGFAGCGRDPRDSTTLARFALSKTTASHNPTSVFTD